MEAVKRSSAIAVLAAGLAGCAGNAPRGEAEELASLLVRYQAVASRPAAELAPVATDAYLAFERKPGETERLWLALVLSTPALRGDEAKLMNVLAPLQSAGEVPSARRALARVLFASAAERLRLRDDAQARCQAAVKEELDRQEKALADKQRQQEAALRGELRRLGVAVQSETQRCEGLEKKLKALRAIDRVAPKRNRASSP
ncbi:MAG: hypothetical protein OHK0026_03950 [Rhodocyclaceae bacterium]